MTADEFKTKFIEAYGIDLDNEDIEPSSICESGKVNRYFTRVKRLVDFHIRQYNPNYNYDKLTTLQLNAYDEATLEQVYYIFSIGDISLMAGFDPVTNAIVDLDALRHRQFSPIAHDILISNGLLYAGIVSEANRNGLLW